MLMQYMILEENQMSKIFMMIIRVLLMGQIILNIIILTIEFLPPQFESWLKNHHKIFDGFDEFINYVKQRRNEEG